MFEASRADGLLISDDRSRLDLAQCHAWLASSYWANDRSREAMERSFQGSRVFGVYDSDGRQLALTRAVTDGATFCWLCDVFVDESARSRGIGTWLVGAIVDSIKRDGVLRFILGTRDAHEIYAKIGFSTPQIPETYMELDERPTRPDRRDVPVFES
jgi:GNAT superfamily N-acetyltransferase